MAVAITVSWRIFSLDVLSDDPYSFAVHTEAFLFSIVRIFHGGTCLVDVVSQYGCYGEILSLLLKPFGLTILGLTIILAIAQIAALLSILVFCDGLIRNPLILVACCLSVFLALNRTSYGVADPYFQYTPLRLFFPALSLVAVMSWQARQGLGRAVLIGAFAAVGVVTNLDSGVFVVGALAILLLFHKPSGETWKRPLLYASAFLVSTGVVLTVIMLALSAKGHRWVDLGSFVQYQWVVLQSGRLMLPMPAPPHVWLVGVACAAVTLTMYGLAFANGTLTPRVERAAYLAVLGAGAFSYYVGRSDIYVLLLAGWPFLVLVFFLLDMQVTGARGQAALAFGSRAVAAVIVLLFALSFVRTWDYTGAATRFRWQRIMYPLSSMLVEDAEYVRAVTKPGEGIAVIALYQASIMAEADRPIGMVGPGLWEIWQKADLDRLADYLLRQGPTHIFVDEKFVLTGTVWAQVQRWLPAALTHFRPAYQIEGTGPGGRLTHLVRAER